MGRGFDPTQIASWTMWQVTMSRFTPDELRGVATFNSTDEALQFSAERRKSKSDNLKMAEFDPSLFEDYQHGQG